MDENLGDKQTAIKLGEKYIARLDDLAKLGNTSRRQLMMSFIKAWLNEFEEGKKAQYFKLAIVLREVEADNCMDFKRRSEFVELFHPDPERPLPIIQNEDDYTYMSFCSGSANMTRHHMMKSMVITGIQELEIITGGKKYDFSVVEPKLKKALKIIMERGFKAYREGTKAK